MDAEGFDPDCIEDRELWRIDNAYGNVYKWDRGAQAFLFHCKLRNWGGRGMSNGARAMRAGDVLGIYQQVTGADSEDALADFLTDLMHWSKAEGNTAFDHELERARGHFEVEVLDERNEAKVSQTGPLSPTKGREQS